MKKKRCKTKVQVKKALTCKVVKQTGIQVQLLGEDGNAFYIMGKVAQALRKAGYCELANEYLAEARKGNYDQLLQTTMNYVEVV